MEEQQVKPDTWATGYREDEIGFTDLVKVIWSRKYLILAGTMLFALGSAVLSWNMEDVYRVGMSITPGIARLSDSGENIFTDLRKDIETSLQLRAFDEKIRQKLHVPDRQNGVEPPKFQLRSPTGLNVVDVSCETAHPELGVQALNHFGSLLQEKYVDLVQHNRKVYEMEQQRKTNELEYLDNRIADNKAEGVTKKAHIKNLRQRQSYIREELGRMSKSTDMLIAERNGLLSGGNSEKNILAVLLYSNAIEQKADYANTLRMTENETQSDIHNFELEITQLQNALEDLERQKKYLLEEITDLELKRNSVRNIEILQPPTISPDPIQPKRKRMVALATASGLFVMLFLAFFLEYIQKRKSELRSFRTG